MKNPERRELPAADDPEAATELAWLKDKQAAFLCLAQQQYVEHGRGALVIRTVNDEPLGDETPISYAALERVAVQEDEVSQQLAGFLENYDPESQFIAVFVHPGEQSSQGVDNINIYQMGVGEEYAANRASDLTPLNQRICEIIHRLGRDEQIIAADIREAQKRVNGHGGYNLDF